MQQKAKFVIQPFKHNQQMDEDWANRTWQTLHDAIREIHRQNASGLSFEELYRNAYNMVLHKFGDKLYAGLINTITKHLQNVAAHVQAANDDAFLPELKDSWDKHKLSSIMIRDILMYMDRTYVAAQKKTPVYERGLQIFRDEVCRSAKIKERLLQMLLDLIQRERQGEMIERGLLKTVTSMLVELGRDVYQRDFEANFLQASSTFYHAESQEYISQNSAADYMKKAEQRLQEEVHRLAYDLIPCICTCMCACMCTCIQLTCACACAWHARRSTASPTTSTRRARARSERSPSTSSSPSTCARSPRWSTRA